MTRSHLLLLYLAVGWGATFPLTRLGLQDMGPMWFVFLRFFLGAVMLWVHQRGRIPELRQTLVPGLVMGALLAGGYCLQTLGLVYTESGRAGFITGLYLILVPLLGWGLFKKPVSRNHWIGAIASLVGLGLLNLKGPPGVSWGDTLVLGGSLCFAFQILWVSKVAPHGNPLGFAFYQNLVTALVAGVLALTWESPSLNLGPLGWSTVLICTLFATYPALLFQLQAQVDTPPSEAALLMSLEAPFAAFFGWMLLGESLLGLELLGAALMFVGVTLAPLKKVWDRSRV